MRDVALGVGVKCMKIVRNNNTNCDFSTVEDFFGGRLVCSNQPRCIWGVMEVLGDEAADIPTELLELETLHFLHKLVWLTIKEQ